MGGHPTSGGGLRPAACAASGSMAANQARRARQAVSRLRAYSHLARFVVVAASLAPASSATWRGTGLRRLGRGFAGSAGRGRSIEFAMLGQAIRETSRVLCQHRPEGRQCAGCACWRLAGHRAATGYAVRPLLRRLPQVRLVPFNVACHWPFARDDHFETQGRNTSRKPALPLQAVPVSFSTCQNNPVDPDFPVDRPCYGVDSTENLSVFVAAACRVLDNAQRQHAVLAQ